MLWLKIIQHYMNLWKTKVHLILAGWWRYFFSTIKIYNKEQATKTKIIEKWVVELLECSRARWNEAVAGKRIMLISVRDTFPLKSGGFSISPILFLSNSLSFAQNIVQIRGKNGSPNISRLWQIRDWEGEWLYRRDCPARRTNIIVIINQLNYPSGSQESRDVCEHYANNSAGWTMCIALVCDIIVVGILHPSARFCKVGGTFCHISFIIAVNRTQFKI